MATNPLPADPDVKIPAAVRASAARAESLIAQMNGDQPGATPNGEAPVTAEGNAPAPHQPVERPNPDTHFQPQTPQTPPSPPAPAPHGEQQTENWEHRYNSMKGRYEAQARQLSDMSAQMSQLQRELTNIQQQAQRRPDGDQHIQRLITPEEESDYGADFLTVVGKKAKEEITPEIAAMKREMDQLRAQFQGVGQNLALSAREKMYQNMDQSMPDWRDLNTNPQFLSWLKLPDTYSGAIRHDLMMAAYERNDAPRLTAFFKGFLAEEAATAPAGYTGPANGASAPQLDLRGLAAPGRAKSAAAQGAPAEKPIFTRAQIQAFYNDASQGKYIGKQEEHDRIERQIFDASRDGRIRER